jgi:hypothetical protein
MHSVKSPGGPQAHWNPKPSGACMRLQPQPIAVRKGFSELQPSLDLFNWFVENNLLRREGNGHADGRHHRDAQGLA